MKSQDGHDLVLGAPLQLFIGEKNGSFYLHPNIFISGYFVDNIHTTCGKLVHFCLQTQKVLPHIWVKYKNNRIYRKSSVFVEKRPFYPNFIPQLIPINFDLCLPVSGN